MAQLAPVIDKLEDVAEPVRAFYVQRDGKYHVDLSGAPAGFAPAADLAAANAKVIEFRDNNVTLKRQVDELVPLKAKFEGIDPDDARKALTEREELKKKGIMKPDDITTIVQTAVQAAVTPLTQQLTTITQTAKEDRARADASTLRSTLSDVFTKSGGEPDALDFMVDRAQKLFVVDNGTVKAAPNQFSADKPGEPLTLGEWMLRQTKEAAFAFKKSGGGGANPQPGNGAPARPQGQLVLKDPTATQLGEHADDIKKGKMRVEYSNA